MPATLPLSTYDVRMILETVTDPGHNALDLAIILSETGRVVGGIAARPGDNGALPPGPVPA